MLRRHQQRIQARACQQPEAYSRWTVRTLARDLALPAATVHEVLVESGLQPHRIRTFTFSPDPEFEAKLLDIVGLYLNPPDHALVLCVDEKTGIQALDRTQPGLPLRAKRPQTWTSEYVRHGTLKGVNQFVVTVVPAVLYLASWRVSERAAPAAPSSVGGS
jgi:hypothetical protein